MKNKTWIGIVAGVLILAAVIAAIITTGNSKPEQSQEPGATVTASPEVSSEPSVSAEVTKEPEQKTDGDAKNTETPKKVKPTFMYFVAETDADYKEAMETFEALKKEYGDRVVFDLKNVTKEPELLENFSFIAGQTPALIMLNTSNDINNFVFASHDQEKLKAEIEAAFTK